MKIIPSSKLLAHLETQNIIMPEGGFDIPDGEYEAEYLEMVKSPAHSSEPADQLKERLDEHLICRFHLTHQNGSQAGIDLLNAQRTAALTRQIVQIADTHLPNVAEKVSAAIDDSKNVVHAAVSELKSVTHLGQQDIVQAVSDLKMFSAESHAEVLKVRGDLHADLMELLAKLHHLGKWFLGVLIAGILFLCAIGIASMILGIHAHAQSTVIIGAQKGTTPSGAVTATQADPNHTGMDMVCISGCAGSSGATTPTNAFANPTTAGMAMSFNAMWNGTSWDLVKGDTTSGVWVNCKSGCAGGSSTPTNAFANPTTAGLSMSFNMMWNGTTWDLVKGDTTNGLWVNCKTGCAGGSSTPTDGFANPTTAGLSQGFTMMWNGASWDRVKGDTTSGLWVNLKSSVALQLATGGNVIGSISNTTFAVTESGTWVMRMQDGSGNALTSNSTTYTAKFALDGNLLGTLGTAFSTPGKIDVIGTVSTTPPANASTNIAQYGGVNVGAGNAFHVQPGTSATWDISDRAARLLGVVYGSQGQQLQQSATNFNAYAELRTGATAYDARQIRALTSADVVTANQGTANSAANGWPTKITDGTNTAGVAADNGQAAATNRVPILPAIALATPPAAATTGRDAALLTDLHRVAYTSQMPTDVTSYVASKQGLVSAASATDIAVLSGNASNAVIVTKIMVSCTQTTAGIIDLILLKRSTADTAGTSTGSPTTVPLDSSNAAGSSSVLTYTANPTTGSLVGNVDTIKLGCMATGTTSPNDIYIWRPSMGQSIVLRGTAQQIAVNLNAATVTGGNFNITFQWIEATNY